MKILLRQVFKIIKKIIISIFLLYSYNIITNQFNLTVPINLYTIFFVTMFGSPGFIGIVLFYILNFR